MHMTMALMARGVYQEPAMSALRDPSKTDELWERHGVRVVGPPLKQKLGLS